MTYATLPPRAPEDQWIPIRYVREPQVCSNPGCGTTIPRGAPGSSKGTRGTKAWRNKVTGEWECMPCRSEGFRAAEARR